MLPTLKGDIAVFSPSGFLDGELSDSIITKDDMAFLNEKKPQSVLISFKKIVFFNKKGLNNVINLLETIKSKFDANIAICDYNEKMYQGFFSMSDKTMNFSLFETEKIAMLFFAKTEDKSDKILIYSKMPNQKNKMALILCEKGYNVRIAGDLDEFERLKADFTCHIKMSHIVSSNKDLKITIKDGAVIYRLSGYMDSSFQSKFDMKNYENMLKVGFKYFIFDGTEISSFNVYGTAFLAMLSVFSAEFGVVIAICNIKNITKQLKNELEDAGILVYDTLEDVFKDETTISGGAGIDSIEHTNITKNLIEILPNIVSIVSSSIAAMIGENIERKQAILTTFNSSGIKDYIGAYISFYGYLEGKILLCIDEKNAQKICRVLLGEQKTHSKNEISSAFAEFMNIIGDKIMTNFAQKKQKIEVTMSRPICDISEFSANKSKGALVEFNLGGEKCILFLIK